MKNILHFFSKSIYDDMRKKGPFLHFGSDSSGLWTLSVLTYLEDQVWVLELSDYPWKMALSLVTQFQIYILCGNFTWGIKEKNENIYNLFPNARENLDFCQQIIIA